MLRKNSIRSYYFVPILLVLLLSVVLISILQLGISINYFSNQKEAQMKRLVISLATQIDKSDGISMEEINNRLGYISYSNDNKMFLLNAEGTIILSTNTDVISVGQKIPAQALQIIKEGVNTEHGSLQHTFPSRNFIAWNGVIIQGKGYYLLAVADGTQLQTYIKDGVIGVLISSVLVLILATILSILILRKTLVPIEKISKAADDFATGHYNARIQVEGDDEFAHLALAFNNMANSLQSIDESRQNFMGNFAHELRTPMTSIKGFIDGLIDGTISEDQRGKYLNIVSEEVGRLSRLVQRMLDISKLEAGEYQFKNSVFNIYDPIISVILSAEQRIESKNIEIKWNQEIEPELVEADRDFLQEVIFNLVDNAIKFTNEGGEISFTIQCIGTQIQVSVKNTGEGISPNDIVHIFERFYKEDESRGRNKNGTGLGLHICRLLINGMGGRIWAESEEGKWFEMSFIVPAANELES